MKERCEKCVFHGNERDRKLFGDDYCFRDYPRTTVKKNCRLRPHKGAKWRDAFIPKSSLLINLDELPVQSLQDKLTKEEKRERIQEYLGRYLKMKQDTA